MRIDLESGGIDGYNLGLDDKIARLQQDFDELMIMTRNDTFQFFPELYSEDGEFVDEETFISSVKNCIFEALDILTWTRFNNDIMESINNLRDALPNGLEWREDFQNLIEKIESYFYFSNYHQTTKKNVQIEELTLNWVLSHIDNCMRFIALVDASPQEVLNAAIYQTPYVNLNLLNEPDEEDDLSNDEFLLNKVVLLSQKILQKLILQKYVEAMGEDIDPDLDESSLSNMSHPNFMQLYFFSKKYGFPAPKESSVSKVIDDSLPNVFLCGISHNTLALARALDKNGGVNTMITPNTTHNPQEKNLTTDYAAVYKDGNLYWVVSDQPLECDYVHVGVNNGGFTAVQSGDVPGSALSSASALMSNKEITSAILKKEEMEFSIPGIYWRSLYNYDFLNQFHESGLINYMESSKIEDIKSDLSDFLKENNCDGLVVKPSRGIAGHLVEFFDSETLDEGALYIYSMLNNGYNVMAEKRIRPPLIEVDGQKKDWNIRTFISRTEEGHPKMSSMVIRFDDDGKQVNLSLSANAMTYEKLVELLGLSSEQASCLHADIEAASLYAYDVIEKYADQDFGKDLNSRSCGNLSGGDWMGIDLMIEENSFTMSANGDYDLALLECNDHKAGAAWHLDTVLPPERQGEAFQDFVKIITIRAKLHKMNKFKKTATLREETSRQCVDVLK